MKINVIKPMVIKVNVRNYFIIIYFHILDCTNNLKGLFCSFFPKWILMKTYDCYLPQLAQHLWSCDRHRRQWWRAQTALFSPHSCQWQIFWATTSPWWRILPSVSKTNKKLLFNGFAYLNENIICKWHMSNIQSK